MKSVIQNLQLKRARFSAFNVIGQGSNLKFNICPYLLQSAQFLPWKLNLESNLLKRIKQAISDIPVNLVSQEFRYLLLKRVRFNEFPEVDRLSVNIVCDLRNCISCASYEPMNSVRLIRSKFSIQNEHVSGALLGVQNMKGEIFTSQLNQGLTTFQTRIRLIMRFVSMIENLKYDKITNPSFSQELGFDEIHTTPIKYFFLRKLKNRLFTKGDWKLQVRSQFSKNEWVDLQVPKDISLADPFLVAKTNTFFAEGFKRGRKYGTLYLGNLQGDQITHLVEVLDTGSHISFPFVFEDDEKVLVIPEMTSNKFQKIYLKNGDSLLHFTDIQIDYAVYDPVLFSYEGKFIIIGSKRMPNDAFGSRALVAFSSTDLSGEWSTVSGFLIWSDEQGRNAGFDPNSSELYTQSICWGIYGHHVNKSKIRINLDDQEELQIQISASSMFMALPKLRTHHYVKNEGIELRDLRPLV